MFCLSISAESYDYDEFQALNGLASIMFPFSQLCSHHCPIPFYPKIAPNTPQQIMGNKAAMYMYVWAKIAVSRLLDEFKCISNIHMYMYTLKCVTVLCICTCECTVHSFQLVYPCSCCLITLPRIKTNQRSTCIR